MALEFGLVFQLIGTFTLLGIGAWFWARRQVRCWYERPAPPPGAFWTALPAWVRAFQIPVQPVALPPPGAFWAALPAWVRAFQRPTHPVAPTPPPAPEPLDATPVPGVPLALAHPPTDLAVTIATLRRRLPQARFRIPLGWSVDPHGHPFLNSGALVGDVNHILITAQSDGGKDNLVLGMLLSLIALHSPREVQIGILDGKGLDFVGWAGAAHTWRLALTPDAMEATMQAISAERDRRRIILSRAGVAKWDTYAGGDLPLLVIFISELILLQNAVGRTALESWMNGELAAGRAFGMRFLIATQTASNLAMGWRSQINVFLAGFQPSQSQDAPNAGLTTREIGAAGAVPPSRLPEPPHGAGVFCFVCGRRAVNMRAPLITESERQRWLAGMPRSEAAPIPEATPEPAVRDTRRQPTPEERQRILDAIQAGARSRTEVCRQVFGTAGGSAYQKVAVVADELGWNGASAPEVAAA